MTNSYIVHASQTYRKDETVESSPLKHHRAHSVGDSHYRFTFANGPLRVLSQDVCVAGFWVLEFHERDTKTKNRTLQPKLLKTLWEKNEALSLVALFVCLIVSSCFFLFPSLQEKTNLRHAYNRSRYNACDYREKMCQPFNATQKAANKMTVVTTMRNSAPYYRELEVCVMIIANSSFLFSSWR